MKQAIRPIVVERTMSWNYVFFEARQGFDRGFEARVLTEAYHNPIFVLIAVTLATVEVNGGKKKKKRLFKS